MALRTEPQWKDFLLAAGIPDAEATTYATKFVQNRITELSIPELSKEILQDMEITVLGDRMAILAHSKTFGASTPTPPAVSEQAYRPPSANVKPPSIVSDMTHPQFRKVRTDWDVYKKLCRLPAEHVGPQLYNACDDTVQTSIINSTTDFFSLNEEEMLESIEKIVTKHVNPAVHRMNFGNMTQSETQSIQDFHRLLVSNAVDCEFSCPECNVDISYVNIKDQFIRGIYNDSLQTDILAKASQLKTVEDVVKHGEAFQAALRDQTCILSTSNLAQINRMSEYRKGKNNSKFSKPLSEPPQHCNGCGSSSHGIPGTNPRHSHCKAWGTICTNCKRPNHFAAACRHPESKSASSLIAHVQFCEKHQTYSAPNLDELEEIPATLTPEADGATSVTSVTINIFPDSGANICLGGPTQLVELKMDVSQLRPCNKRVKAVGGGLLECHGWIPMKFEVGEYETIRPVFFCEQVDKLYFSKGACKDVNILPQCYPFPMPRNIATSSSSVSSIESKTSDIIAETTTF